MFLLALKDEGGAFSRAPRFESARAAVDALVVTEVDVLCSPRRVRMQAEDVDAVMVPFARLAVIGRFAAASEDVRLGQRLADLVADRLPAVLSQRRLRARTEPIMTMPSHARIGNHRFVRVELNRDRLVLG